MKTKNKLKHHKQFHKLSSDYKLKWFGNGEWVEEPDLCCFKYKNYSCSIVRVNIPDGPKHIFGGSLCGYIILKPTQKYYNLSEDEIREVFQLYWGVTYDEFRIRNNDRIIGFDCAHSSDIIPSMIERTQIIQNDFAHRFPSLSKYTNNLFSLTYKNIKFVENSLIECIDNL